MRTKVDGWRRKGMLRASVMQLKRDRTLVVLALGLILLLAVTMTQRVLHLRDDTRIQGNDEGSSISSARLPGTIMGEEFHCDRSQFRTDICNMRGDIRMEFRNKSTRAFVLYAQDPQTHVRKETVKPYTRKWEEGSMSTVNEVVLQTVPASPTTLRPECEVQHKVPGVVFSTGGYTGNLYHEFNDGLIPLFITTQHLHREVVVIISSFHKWWYSKYRDLVGQMTKYEIIDLEKDRRVHCFPEIEAGLHIHGELSVDPGRMPRHETIQEFHALLDRAYKPHGLREEHKLIRSRLKERKTRPRLTIIVRESTRKFLNLGDIVELAERVGFAVSLLNPVPTLEMKKIYWALNNTDVLLGVHGAAMTHLLFMRPGTVFMQVVPIGTDWAANEYYGEPATKLGLKYVPYKIEPGESSLSDKYNSTDPILVDPESITQKGWWTLKKIYLEGQDVRPSLHRLRGVLQQAKTSVEERKTQI